MYQVRDVQEEAMAVLPSMRPPSTGTCHLEFPQKLFDNQKKKLSTLSVSVESLTLKEPYAMFITQKQQP